MKRRKLSITCHLLPASCLSVPASSLQNLASCLKSSILCVVDRANIVIVGGGVVGCAVARAVSQRWNDVFLVEQMPKLGMGVSTRNSGVIHSGIYYPPGSLKARFCVAGDPKAAVVVGAPHGPPTHCVNPLRVP